MRTSCADPRCRHCQDTLFLAVDSGIATYAIISMLTGVCFWYSPKGRLAADEIIAIHKHMVLGSLNGAPRENAKIVALGGGAH